MVFLEEVGRDREEAVKHGPEPEERKRARRGESHGKDAGAQGNVAIGGT